METKSALEAILERHSVRSYKAKKVDEDLIDTLLTYAVRAPTAMHQEPCAFVVIQDQALLREISDLAKPLFRMILHAPGRSQTQVVHDFSDPDFNIFYGADTLIVIMAKLPGDFIEADCWLAAENLMVAATQMALGTCVIGSALMALNTPDMKSQLNIPDEYTPVAPIIVGYPSGITTPSSRKKPVVLSWVH